MPDKERNGRLYLVIGTNFSGRTKYLKNLESLSREQFGGHKFVYIGEQPGNYLSGIFPTVRDEIRLHQSAADPGNFEVFTKILAEFKFDQHLDKNPFTLSGGEQTLLIVLLNLMIKPATLAVDVALEQLDSAWREKLLTLIVNGALGNMKIYVADNRLDEYKIERAENVSPLSPGEDNRYTFEMPFFNPAVREFKQAPSIELTDLSYNYRLGHTVLDGINIRLEPGNIYNLKGNNGAGKSTLAKLITGVLKLKKGKILVDDRSYDSYKYPGTLCGYSFQNPDDQLFSSSVEDEVLPVFKNENQARGQRREFYLSLFGLQSVRKVHPGDLPFVMRKRITLAAALAMDCPWFILDEPTLGQDSQFISFFIEVLNWLVACGKGIIIITHSQHFVRKLNCKTLNLISGKLST